MRRLDVDLPPSARPSLRPAVGSADACRACGQALPPLEAILGDTACWRCLRHATAGPEPPPVATKCCRRCGETKPLSDFYKGRRVCQPCVRAEERERRARDPEAARARRRAWGQTESGRASLRKSSAKYAAKHPERRRASQSLRAAIEKGDVLRAEVCEAAGCGLLAVAGHHERYDRPLAVMWLCGPHHEAVHHVGPVELKPGRRDRRRWARAPRGQHAEA